MTVGITELPPEGMQLAGVALAGDSDRGTRTTEGLSLLFTTAGITVQGPQPQIERLLVWSGLDSATCHEKMALPDGRNAAVMELTSGGQSIRFLLPTDTVSPGQAAYLDQALPAWLARYRGPGVTRTTDVGESRAEDEPADAEQAGAERGAAPTTTRRSEPAPASQSASRAESGSAATGKLNGSGGAQGTTSTVGSPPAPAPAPAPAPPPPPAQAPAPAPAPVGSRAGAAPPPPGQPAQMAASASAAASTAPPPPAASPPPPPPVPPPPSMPGTVTWVLSTDPLPEGTAWDDPPLGEALADAPPAPKKRWGWRKTKVAAAPGPPGLAPPPPVEDTGMAPAAAAGANGRATAASSAASSAAPTSAPASEPDTSGSAGAAPTTPVTALVDESDQPPPWRLGRFVAIAVALVAVIGGITYLAAGRQSSPPTPATVSPPAPPTSVPFDNALVASINLRLADLPSGWTEASPSAPLLHLPVANSTVEAQAIQALSTCLGVPVPTAAGLFAGGPLPGHTAVALSPNYVDGIHPGIQMRSMTTAVGSPAEAQSLAAPFENPAFAGCYGQFARTTAAAAIPGAVAAVQLVTLSPPAGVKSYGFITTVTSSQGTQVFGQAYMVGGRLVTDLMPATNGPSIPSSDFVPAYTAVSNRISTNIEK